LKRVARELCETMVDGEWWSTSDDRW
jgi:hypothetical protein